jgi:serine/threonine protein kinase
MQKKQFWLSKGKSLDKIDNMKKEDKLAIRRNIHNSICKKIFEQLKQNPISKNDIDEKYLKQFSISLRDFGSHCDEDTYYEESFGTRYYQAPEIILMGKCSYPVDIWALGCVFYELLTGELLFDPVKDKIYSRDYYHLCLISETCGSFDKDFIANTKYAKKSSLI